MAESKHSRGAYYIATLNTSKKNSELLEKNNTLKRNKIRNVDYLIVSESKWKTMREGYDVEIPVGDVYDLYISFRCHGESHKNIYVQGTEKVFDAILTLFVNKMLELEAFNRLFVVRWRGKAIDPTISFAWFGTERRSIELTVERRVTKHKPGSDSTEELSSTRGSPLLYVSSRSTSSRAPCVGLPNLGNTCYMNSAVQCLNNCSSFVDLFLANSSLLLESKNRIVREWTRLLCTMNSGGAPSIAPFKTVFGEAAPVFRGHEEQDSCEFLSILLETLHDALKSDPTLGSRLSAFELVNQPEAGSVANESNAKGYIVTDPNELSAEDHTGPQLEKFWADFVAKNSSPIASHFYGVFANSRECTACHSVDRTYDPILTLPLSIPSGRMSRSPVLVLFDSPSIQPVPGLLDRLPRVRQPVTIHVPTFLDVNGLNAYTRKHLQVSGQILAVEYNKERPKRLLDESTPLSSVRHSICLYEHSGEPFFICSLNFRKLFFFKEKFPVDFLIPSCNHSSCSQPDTNSKRSIHNNHSQFVLCDENMRRIFTKLEPHLLYSISSAQFFTYINSIEIDPDPVFLVPHVALHTSSQSFLFGNNMELLAGGPPGKPDPHHIYDCISDFLKEAKFPIKCCVCGVETEHIARLSLHKMPKVLIFQLKRFAYERTEAKINTFIDYPLRGLKVGGASYNLIASCNHIEIGMGYGHYVAYVYKHNSWYCANDSVISKCETPEKKSAYLLFYERSN